MSLNSQTLIGLGIFAFGLIGSFMFAINTEGKKLVFTESSRLIRQTGDNAVSDLTSRSKEVAGLTRTLGITSEQLPKSETTFKNFIPKIIDFQGDLGIAGGGVWPEPYKFNSNVARRSFFWGRELDGTLKYYDDYNQSGYHNEDWYVIARYLKPGRCFWSRSYVDPFSQQPMVTCTIATQEGGEFSGAVTIDVKLEGLQAFTESWQKKTNGYVFIVDRDNKFISFPDPKLVQRVEKDSKGKTKTEFILASELAAVKPQFSPIAEALAGVNQEMLQQARQMPNYKPETAANLERASYQINQQQAELMSVILADPLGGKTDSNRLLKQFELKDDWLLQEKSTVYIFHVPNTYWKLVIVKPVAESVAVADSIAQFLINRVAFIVALGALLALVAVKFRLLKPIQSLSQAAKEIEHNPSQLSGSEWEQELPTERRDEIGSLAQTFSNMAVQLKQSFATLEKQNQDLAQTKEQLKAVIDAVPGSISWIDSGGLYIGVNRYLAENWNLSQDAFIGKEVGFLTGNSQLAEFMRQFLASSQESASQVIEIEVNESPRYYLIAAQKYQQAEGKATVSVGIDVTERKQAEEALRIAESNYRSIFENALEGIFQSTTYGKFIRVNPAMASIYGYESPAAMIGDITDIDTQIYVDYDNRKEFKRRLTEYGQVKNWECQVYAQDGSTIWIEEDTRSVYDSQGNLLYYEGMIQDITERKRREADLQKQLEELRVEIDHQKREQEVAMITQSEYFQELQEEIAEVNLDEFWS
ncbi:MAG: PAS domain S-box protein [Calothrix sp. MO_192.B10]|nr:PAS domain S-box protein [Calothrix sp. MO_192.B10]